MWCGCDITIQVKIYRSGELADMSRRFKNQLMMLEGSQKQESDVKLLIEARFAHGRKARWVLEEWKGLTQEARRRLNVAFASCRDRAHRREGTTRALCSNRHGQGN